MVPDSVADALHLKQIGQPSIAVAGEKSDDIEAAAEDDNAPAEAVDTTKQRLLIIGDSMTQLLALRLSDYANKNGHTLTCVTWNGSGTKQWSETDTLHKMCIIGDMKELGSVSHDEHQRIVDQLAAMRLEQVWLVGEEFENCSTPAIFRKFDNVSQVKEAIAEHKPQGMYILVKGSNGTRLFELPQYL